MRKDNVMGDYEFNKAGADCLTQRRKGAKKSREKEISMSGCWG